MNHFVSLRWSTFILSSGIISLQATSANAASGQLLPLTPSYHTFHDTQNASKDTVDVTPISSNGNNEICNSLNQLVDAYPAYVTLTTTQKLFGVDRQQQSSYALIIQDKQSAHDMQDSNDIDVSFTQLELSEDESNLKGVVDWLRHSVNDDAITTDTAASTNKERATEKEAVPSKTTTHKDIILSATDIGGKNVIGLAKVMLEAANCESMNDGNLSNNGNLNFSSDRRLHCRNELKDAGVASQDAKCLAHLVFTRRTIILPSAVAYGDTVPHHDRLNFLPLLFVACISLFIIVASMTILISRRRRRDGSNKIWLEEEARRQVQVAEDDDHHVFFQKDYTSELTSFDEELTVQLIEPSHSVILV